MPMKGYDMPGYEDPAFRAINDSGVPLTAPSFRPDQYSQNTPAAANSAVSVAQGATPPPGEAPSYQNPNENLSMWGYTGEIPINNMEQQALDFINELYATQGPLGTLSPAQDFYNQVLSGSYGPEGQAYIEAILDPMRASNAQQFGEKQKAMANRFGQYGGYFGGKHGVAQGRLGAENMRDMAELESGLRYQGFADNLSRMGDAAGGLRGLAMEQSGMSQDMINALLAGGGLITGRDALNRSEYQNAAQRSYNDWVRARNEALMPFGFGSEAMGMQATQPFAITEQSPWGAILGGIGSMVGNVGTSGLTKALKLG